ncbi:hypothetical protein L1887_31178 [Cichorium endivia]|nr:hypothetical protein L1887_31178 [Cichorium endivia]
MIVEVSGGSGDCRTTGCVDDLNQRCPTELKVEGGGGCRSACEAFGTPEYCCKGEFDSPKSCQPTAYSQVFKTACPRSYSYAYDDATMEKLRQVSLFTVTHHSGQQLCGRAKSCKNCLLILCQLHAINGPEEKQQNVVVT